MQYIIVAIAVGLSLFYACRRIRRATDDPCRGCDGCSRRRDGCDGCSRP